MCESFQSVCLKKINDYGYGRRKNVFPTSLFKLHGTPFLIRNLNVLCVPCCELVRFTCGTRPGNSVLTVTCPELDRSKLRSNGHKRIHTGYLQDAERTRTGKTAYQRIINVYLPDIIIMILFKTCQRIRPDKTGIN